MVANKILVGDFETTVYKGQERTDVWASALVEMYTEDVLVMHTIGETFDYLQALKQNVVVYYHNLKFDGSFWMHHLLVDRKFIQCLDEVNTERGTTYVWKDDKDMPNGSFKYSISDMGQWYNFKIKYGGHIIELRDSLKLLPFSVDQIGKSFNTKHRKLSMKYEGLRYPGCEITPKEKQYIANDVLVVKEALEFMFKEGHNKLTIGACCLAEYKKIMGKEDYKAFFPNLYDVPIDPETFGSATAGDYVKKSYGGGWCYLVKGKEGRVFCNGVTADVNSLYPSMMSSESGNYYPVGMPTFWKGNYIDPMAIAPDKYYFVRVKTRFYIKKNKLPFIQAKGNLLYKQTEHLTTSDVWWEDKKTHKGTYLKEIIGIDGDIIDTRMELTLTMTDFQLLRDHYNLVDFEILDGCYFHAECGIFDKYIEKYKKIKMESKGAMRQLAKLFLNNLYGKMAASTNSSFKVAYVNDNGVVAFRQVEENDKVPGYIPVGSAITSYARNFTIRAAQKNYHGVDKPGFIYADTDSIHCDLPPHKVKGITVHPKNFCCWDLESYWSEAIFTRQKTYIEFVTHEEGEPVDKPYYNVKCAGMPKKCKDLFVKSMMGISPNATIKKEDDMVVIEEYGNEPESYTLDEYAFINEKRSLIDFNIGLCVPGKLRPKRIPGGVLLVTTNYKMR